MSEPVRPAPRPTRVTLASVMGAVGCLVLVVSLFDTMARLRSTDTRQEVTDLLADPPFRGSGIGVDQVLAGLRALGYTAGALAAAGVVLAVFVALRHRGARIGFTVVAALLLLTMPTTGLMPVIPALAAGLLWRRDVRDWFAGRAPTPPSPAPSSALPPPPAPPPSAPGPYAATGPYAEPGPHAAPAPAPGSERRPGTVTTAAVLSLAGATLGLLAGLSALLVLAASPSTVEDALAADSQLERLDMGMDQVIAVLWVTGAVMVLWSLVAMVLAVMVLRRSSVARVLLAISAGMAALFSLLAIVSGVAAVTLLLGAVTVGLLVTRSANDWFARRPPGSGPAPRISGSGQPW